MRFTHIAAPPCTNKENRQFQWDPACQDAFDTLKERLAEAPLLVLPRDEDLFVLDTDASNVTVGMVLSQALDSEKLVIAYYSRLHAQTEVNYCTSRNELLTVVEGLRQFRPYVLGRHCMIRTDHDELRWFWRAPNLVGQQARWLDFLGEFDFEIAYRPGYRNRNADALSRRSCRARVFCRGDPPYEGLENRAAVVMGTPTAAKSMKTHETWPLEN